MALRPAQSSAPSTQLRPSVRADRAAELCDCDVSHIYKLLKRKELEGWKDGRAVKVFIDSIEARQSSNLIGGREAQPAAPKSSRRKPVPAAYQIALSRLQQRGVL